MTSAPNIHSKVIYECCPEPYLDITVYLMLRWLYRGMFGKRLFFALSLIFSLISTTSACSLSRRRTLYYFSNLIGPCVLIARSPKRFFKDFRSIYSIYIWMHVISAWLFSVSISRLTLGKRCSCNNFSPKEDFVTSGDRILSYFVIFLLQVTLEITVLMSLTFFMNMVSSNKNQKVKMRPWL